MIGVPNYTKEHGGSENFGFLEANFPINNKSTQ